MTRPVYNLQVLTWRLDLATTKEEEEQRGKSWWSLVTLLILIYGLSEVAARSQARQWLTKYSAEDIRRRVFRRVLYSSLKRGVDLISTISGEQRGQFLGDLFRLGRGRGIVSIRRVYRLLREKYGLSESTARLIAIDQSRKYEAAVEQARQVAQGQSTYRWWTMLDDRVRPTHRLNHGQVFSWVDPPETGPPGFEINCRCVPVSV